MISTQTVNTMNSRTTLADSKFRIKIVNGERTKNGAEGLVSVSAACRMIGVKQHGPARKQMHNMGIPIVALGGAQGGVYLVRVDDVLKAKAKRDALAEQQVASEQKAAKQKSNVISLPKPVEETVTVESVNEFITDISKRMDMMEAKLDKLLAAWGIDAA